MILKVAKIWANSSLNYSSAPKGDYHQLCLSGKPHHPATFQKNPCSLSLDIGCISLAQIGSKLTILPKTDFLPKLTVTIVYLYSFVLQHFKNNHQRANHETEGCIILAQLGSELLSQKGIFWKN